MKVYVVLDYYRYPDINYDTWEDEPPYGVRIAKIFRKPEQAAKFMRATGPRLPDSSHYAIKEVKVEDV